MKKRNTDCITEPVHELAQSGIFTIKVSAERNLRALYPETLSVLFNVADPDMKDSLLNVLTLVVLIQTLRVADARMQDLSYYYDEHLIRWPGHKPWIYNTVQKNFTTPTNLTLW